MKLKSKWHIVWLVVVVALGVVMMARGTVRYGIGYDQKEVRIPLCEKVVHFYSRHFLYKDIARQVVLPGMSSQEKVAALFDWTVKNISQTIPEGGAIKDDHVAYVIIRGYGSDDQIADVFCTLCAEAGIKATMYQFRHSSGNGRRIGAVVWLDGTWRVFDTTNGMYFLDKNGRIASIEEVNADPEIVAAAARRKGLNDAVYTAYFSDLKAMPKVGTVRAETQIPIKRLIYEIKKFFHIGIPPQLFYG